MQTIVAYAPKSDSERSVKDMKKRTIYILMLVGALMFAGTCVRPWLGMHKTFGQFDLKSHGVQVMDIKLPKRNSGWSIQSGDSGEFEYFTSDTIVTYSVSNLSSHEIQVMGIQPFCDVAPHSEAEVFSGPLSEFLELGANFGFYTADGKLRIKLIFRVITGHVDKKITITGYSSPI